MFKLFVLILLCYSTALYAQIVPPRVKADYEAYFDEAYKVRAAGKKLRKEFNYEINANGVGNEKYVDKEIKYLRNGHINEIISIDKHGRTETVTVLKYNQNYLPLRSSEFLPTGDRIGQKDYYYVNGALQSIVILDDFGKVVSKVIYTIDIQKNTVDEKTFVSRSEVSERVVYFYSSIEDGYIEREMHYKGESNLLYSKVYTRENGVLISEDYMSPENELVFTILFKYDQRGNAIKKLRQVSSGGTMDKGIYQYNDDNLITAEIEYNSNGFMVYYYKYTYE